MFVAATLIAVGCSQVKSAPSPAELVPTASGAVSGVVKPTYRLFAGIPYAAPPVGSLRWRPPEPMPRWSGVRNAVKPGPGCIQGPVGDPDFAKQTDEDCLTLNVWTPPEDGRQRPVMVWIHGGGFTAGAAQIYNARWLVERGDIVVVTINYRLGALGFLAHPALGPPGDVGNYGLADQQAALRWVQQNIAHFGGDPGRVTVAGESAGAISICDHLVAPGSAGLFRAAIIQSGPCQAQGTLPTAEDASIAYAAKIGCEDPRAAADCLRALPADTLRRHVFYYRFAGVDLTGPVSGSAVLPVDPVTAIDDGRAARVPVLIGTNRDEFTAFLANLYNEEDFGPEDYPGLLDEAFGAHGPAVLAQYPLDGHDSVPSAYSAALTDSVFACSSDRVADALAEHAPVYAYEFNDRTAPKPDSLNELPFPAGAAHGLELRYLFDMGGAPKLNNAQQRLSDEMIRYWSEFVKTGSPGPDWPALRGGQGGDGGEVMSLQLDGSRLTTTFEQTHRCPFWAEVEG
ncbi:carboxylesterase/lipase family protein [Mycolicibacterium sp. XJ1819]